MAVTISEEKYKEFLELSGGTKELLIELLNKFLETTPSLLQKAREALKVGDGKKVDYYIHTMKGSALSLGLVPLSQFLVELNKRSKEGNFLDFDKALDTLEKYLEEVKEYQKQIIS